MNKYFLIICILFFAHVHCQQKLKPEELKADFDFVVNELKAQHQGLYKYEDQQKTNKRLDSIRNTLNTAQTRLAFYEKLRFVIGLTNEGHTEVSLPQSEMLKLGLSSSFMPLAVELCEEHLIITQHYGKQIEGLQRGVKIVSVNDKKTEEILEALYPLIPSDGFNTTSKKAWVGGFNFALLYRLVFGKQKFFQIRIQKYGEEKIETLTLPAIPFTNFIEEHATFEEYTFDYHEFAFEQLNDSIAYLSVPSFGNDDLDYDQFYKKHFKKIDSLKIKHLIIDIQANGGGTEGNENLLYSYLSNKVVKKYNQVTMLPKPYLKNKSKEGYIEDQWAYQDSTATRGAFTLYSDYYSDLGYSKPKSDLVFKGKLYVLISGKTFSGGAEFASLIKMTQRGTFIGEETGGAYEGNVSGYAEYIQVPHSKIEIKIPTVHFEIQVSPQIKGRGVMPDYTVHQTWGDYMKIKNTKKIFTLNLIAQE